MAWTQLDQDALETAYLSGGTRVRYGDRDVTYASASEMKERIEIGRALLGLPPMFGGRQTSYATHSKGLT